MDDKNILITIDDIWSKPDMQNIEKLMKQLRVLEHLLFVHNVGQIDDVNDVLMAYYEDTKKSLLKAFFKDIKNISFDEVNENGNLVEIDENKKIYKNKNKDEKN